MINRISFGENTNKSVSGIDFNKVKKPEITQNRTFSDAIENVEFNNDVPQSDKFEVDVTEESRKLSAMQNAKAGIATSSTGDKEFDAAAQAVYVDKVASNMVNNQLEGIKKALDIIG